MMVMFRFTIRDVLWLTVVVAALLGWWGESRNSAALKRERDEATASWHDASKKWIDATARIPRNPQSGLRVTGATEPPPSD